MNENRIAVLYTCKNCGTNFERKKRKCPHCGGKIIQVYDDELPLERDWSKDSSYFDYITKKKEDH